MHGLIIVHRALSRARDALGVLGPAKPRLRLRSPGEALAVLGSAEPRLRLRSPAGLEP